MLIRDFFSVAWRRQLEAHIKSLSPSNEIRLIQPRKIQLTQERMQPLSQGEKTGGEGRKDSCSKVKHERLILQILSMYLTQKKHPEQLQTFKISPQFNKAQSWSWTLVDSRLNHLSFCLEVLRPFASPCPGNGCLGTRKSKNYKTEQGLKRTPKATTSVGSALWGQKGLCGSWLT